MKLGIISDTHDNLDATRRAAEIFRNENVDAIIHLGDFVAPFTLKLFDGFKLYGVFGNNDGEKLLLRKVANELNFVIEEAPLELKIWGKKFVLVHGWGSVERTKSIIDSLAKSQIYDFVLYGHTHLKEHRKVGKSTIINPGEACGYLTGKKSIAILNLDEHSVQFILME